MGAFLNFLIVKHNLYKTLRANRLDGALPILEAFFADYVREISFQKCNTKMEIAQRQHEGCAEELNKWDEQLVVHTVVAALKKHVTLHHDKGRVSGTLFFLSDGRENDRS